MLSEIFADSLTYMLSSFKRSLLAATALVCASCRRQNFGLHPQIQALGNDSLENESSNESLLAIESTRLGNSVIDHRSGSDRTISSPKVSELLNQADSNVTAENNLSERSIQELQEKSEHNRSIFGVLSSSGLQVDPGAKNSTLWLALTLGMVLGWCCCISLMHGQEAQAAENSTTKKGKFGRIFSRTPTDNNDDDDESYREYSHQSSDRSMFSDQRTRSKKKAVKFAN